MFNLVGNQDQKPTKDSQPMKGDNQASALFYQTENCRTFVEEAFRFEGVELSKSLAASDENIGQFVRENRSQIILIELTESDDVTKDMQRISNLLPNGLSVIVIGGEDTIHTVRNLKEMGFYYLYWPCTKQEVIDFVNSVVTDGFNESLSRVRYAKRVAVLGVKGGVGTSLITAELGKELSEKYNSSCLIVDRNFVGGNVDIMLGLKQFKKREVKSSEINASFDESYTMSMTQPVNNLLSVLAIESEDLSEVELKEYIEIQLETLATKSNFILGDYSGSASIKQDIKHIAKHADIILLVIERSVSGLREAKRIKQLLEDHNSTARCLYIVNNTRPQRVANVTMEEVDKHLQQKVDVVCPFEPSLSLEVLKGKGIYNADLKISESINQITALLLGESREPAKKNLLNRLFARG